MPMRAPPIAPCLAAFLACSLALASSGVSADSLPEWPPAKPGPWQQGAKARAALKPWATCEMQKEAVAPAAEGEQVRARKVGRAADVERHTAGSGRWATATVKTWRLDAGTCMGAGFEATGGKESLWAWVSLLAAGAVATHERAAAISDATLVTDQRGAELAAARLLLELTREPPAVRPIDPPAPLAAEELRAQLEHPGPPRGGKATLWSPHALKLADLPLGSAAEGPDAPPAHGVLVGAIRAPAPLLTRGRWQLWELRFKARVGGGLLAVYDRQRKQHRWVFATEQDRGRGGHFDILGVRGEVAFLRTSLDDDQALWAIDLPSGRARRVQRSGPFRLLAGDQLEVSDGAGGVELVPLSAVRP